MKNHLFGRALLLVGILMISVIAMQAQAALRVDTSAIDQNSEAFKRFKGFVDAAVNGNPGYAFSASDAATMYLLTGKEKYCEFAAKMIQGQVDEANAMITAGQRPPVAGDSYLEAGPIISALALTWEACREQISDGQRTTWSAYAEQTLWNIWNPKQARWGDKAFEWTGWSIDNPGNNYYYSFVEATMYWALASNNEKWLTLLRDEKLPALQAYFSKLTGGGSLEGTGYGAAHMRLFAIYRVWKDSTGIDLANANNHLSDSIRFWVNATMPTLDRFAPIGDQSRVSIPEIYDYHRRLVLEARNLSSDEEARSMASWWLNSISIEQMTHGFNYIHDLLPAGDKGLAPASMIYLASGTGHLFARTGWDRKATWLGFNAGPYLESHAHQDQGAFTLFAGDWLAVTENIWTHSGIQQGTDVHNVVRFERNGTIIRQRAPSTSTLTVIQMNAATGDLQAKADLGAAYGADSGVHSWTRKIDFKDGRLTVSDQFSTTADTVATFQINVPVRPSVNGRQASAGRLRVNVLEPADAELSVLDWSTLDPAEFKNGWRIDVRGSGDAFVVELSSEEG